MNTLQPKTIFNINATLPTDTDILTIENQNDYIRNIIAQNKNERGIVIDASNATSNIHFTLILAQILATHQMHLLVIILMVSFNYYNQ